MLNSGLIVVSGQTLGYDSWYLLPFGRGSVKITNNQPYSGGFSIDPRYYANRFDLLAQAATTRFTRSVSQASPLNQDVSGEKPPSNGVPGNADLNAWSNFVKGSYRSNWSAQSPMRRGPTLMTAGTLSERLR